MLSSSSVNDNSFPVKCQAFLFLRLCNISVMLFFLLGVSLGAVSPSADQVMKLECGSCPMFWYSFNGRCYKYVATRMSWADAEFHCLSEKANLVSIHSQNEQKFVKNLIKNFDPAQGVTWIGLSDLHKEGRWMWSDGTVARYALWTPGEPNNDHGNGHCVHTSFGTEKKWNDCPCSGLYPSVCASRVSLCN